MPRSAHSARLAVTLALPLVALAGAASADLLEGTVLAHDRVARVIVMKDRSVIPLDNLESELPADLVAGDRIAVSFDSNEDDGIRVVNAVTRLD